MCASTPLPCPLPDKEAPSQTPHSPASRPWPLTPLALAPSPVPRSQLQVRLSSTHTDWLQEVSTNVDVQCTLDQLICVIEMVSPTPYTPRASAVREEGGPWGSSNSGVYQHPSPCQGRNQAFRPQLSSKEPISSPGGDHEAAGSSSTELVRIKSASSSGVDSLGEGDRW